ncbi:hypothetical protein BC830DRAFT_536683 [Chytriomyces sp. MP71]|nr:hypothetical protein BC830DRAFT_536683 [Chytriomyces sp. MP71]
MVNAVSRASQSRTSPAALRSAYIRTSHYCILFIYMNARQSPQHTFSSLLPVLQRRGEGGGGGVYQDGAAPSSATRDKDGDAQTAAGVSMRTGGRLLSPANAGHAVQSGNSPIKSANQNSSRQNIH